MRIGNPSRPGTCPELGLRAFGILDPEFGYWRRPILTPFNRNWQLPPAIVAAARVFVRPEIGWPQIHSDHDRFRYVPQWGSGSPILRHLLVVVSATVYVWPPILVCRPLRRQARKCMKWLCRRGLCGFCPTLAQKSGVPPSRPYALANYVENRKAIPSLPSQSM
jgi:hypothetical protein